MKEIILFDPSFGTTNVGDEIINEAVMREMGYIFNDNFLTRYSTHTPLVHSVQLLIPPNFIVRTCNSADLKFIGGSNIFKNNLLYPRWDWNINVITKPLYKNSVVIGGGVEGMPDTINSYTRHIYKKVLSKDFIHSARDETTKTFMESLGVKAINTGCPTLWRLSKEHCAKIPSKKSKNVIFTLTDYKKNPVQDLEFIKILKSNYNKIFFWPQGVGDFNYLNTLVHDDSIVVLPPNLNGFRKKLEEGEVDYIGTRLHAGIFSMQNMVRSIVIVIDNRARDMSMSYNIKTVDIDKIDTLSAMINSEFKTDVEIDEAKIKEWKRQFID